MALTEEDKNWIMEAIMKASQPNATVRFQGRQPQSETRRVEQVTKTGESVLIGGVRLAGLGLSVVARTAQVTTKAIGAGVDMYVDELGKAMGQRHRPDSLLD